MPALLLYGDTQRNAAIRHELPLAIMDPLLFVELDGRHHVLTTPIERDRIERVRPDVEILDVFDFGIRDLLEAGVDRSAAVREANVRAVKQIGLRAAIVPGDFPYALAERLKEAGIELTVDDTAVDARRRAKSPDELAGIRLAQTAATAGMAAARDALREATPGDDGRAYRDGQPLLAEDVRAAIRAACDAAGAPCPPDVMVSSAWAGFGHDPGFGPLPAGLPIVVDLWPRHEATACWADMTRTFIVGPPRPDRAAEIAAMEALVAAAFNDALSALRPGVRCRDVYALVCDHFEAAGWPTQRTAGTDRGNDGFQFALGHGVGLEVHEAPYLGLGSDDELVAGDVVAIEPGLHRDGLGMVRFEDLLVITETGAENLTDFPYELG